MFFGQFDHSVDDKGRLTIPARYRTALKDSGYILLGLDDNLMVMTDESFKKITAEFSQKNMAKFNTRQMGRALFSSAEKFEIDKNGRILIPQYLRDAIGLKNSAKLVGVGSIFEIWSPEFWEKNQESIKDGKSRADLFSDLEFSF